MSDAGMNFAAPELIELDQGQVFLRAGHCKNCGELSFPMTSLCWHCRAEAMEPVRLARQGNLYAFSVVHAAPKGWRVPYVLGYVDLPEGIRMLAHIDAAPEALRPDLPVRLDIGIIRNEADGTPVHSYVFAPEQGAR